jgi:hypothetical protein
MIFAKCSTSARASAAPFAADGLGQIQAAHHAVDQETRDF